MPAEKLLGDTKIIFSLTLFYFRESAWILNLHLTNISKEILKKVSNELRAPSGNTPDMTIEEKRFYCIRFFET